MCAVVAGCDGKGGFYITGKVQLDFSKAAPCDIPMQELE